MNFRVKLIVANWKMNKTLKEAVASAKYLMDTLSDINNANIVVAPPFLSISAVTDIFKKSHISVSAQDVFWEKNGAFTGEISADMLIDSGCKYVIVGHSERRFFLNETCEIINKKIKTSIDANLCPIFCIGENSSDRLEGRIFSILEKQIELGLKDISFKDGTEIIIAYEPVWAIGSGNAATKYQIQEAHLFIRSCLSKLYSSSLSENISIIYGGSINSKNIKEVTSLPDVDGSLIGSASLKPDIFTELVHLIE